MGDPINDSIAPFHITISTLNLNDFTSLLSPQVSGSQSMHTLTRKMAMKLIASNETTLMDSKEFGLQSNTEEVQCALCFLLPLFASQPNGRG